MGHSGFEPEASPVELLILRKFLKHNIQLLAVLRSLGIYSIRNRLP